MQSSHSAHVQYTRADRQCWLLVDILEAMQPLLRTSFPEAKNREKVMYFHDVHYRLLMANPTMCRVTGEEVVTVG